MPASAIARFSSANSRAFSDNRVRRSRATETAIRFQWEMVLSVQKKAMTVWSGVRVEPVARPNLLTSSKSLA